MNSIVKNTIILTVITLLSGLILGGVYQLTKEPIAKQQEKTRQAAFRTVIPEGDSFEVLSAKESQENASESDTDNNTAAKSNAEVTEAVCATDTAGNIVGYCIMVTSHEGYGGDINISVGVLPDGTVSGVEILEISETAGLGMRANTPEFKGQFAGKTVEGFAYSKTGASADNEIDALSGATITTNAMTNAVNEALRYKREVIGE